MGLSRGYEMATDAEFKGLSNFATPVRAGRITAIELSGQVRVETDDPEGGDVLAWPLNGAIYEVGNVVYVDFAVNNPESAIVVGSKSSVPRLDHGFMGARVYNNANISCGDGGFTALTFNSERYDTDAFHSTSSNTGRLTVPVAGVYNIIAQAAFAAHATGIRGIQIRLNGSTLLASNFVVAFSGASADVMVVTNSNLAVNDYVEVLCFQNSGGALNALAGANYSPEFMIARLGSV